MIFEFAGLFVLLVMSSWFYAEFGFHGAFVPMSLTSMWLVMTIQHYKNAVQNSCCDVCCCVLFRDGEMNFFQKIKY